MGYSTTRFFDKVIDGRNKPKIAFVYAAAIYVTCPYCKADVVNNQGSVMIDTAEFEPKTFKHCTSCSKEFQLPQMSHY